MSESEFRETSGKHAKNDEQQRLLARRICDLPVTIKGTRLESLVGQLYQNLDAAGISFKPGTYLTDEWGCPDGVPIIGIPFYCADLELSRLHSRLTDSEALDEIELMRYLRHEAGHAFNYAYRLCATQEWQRLFGQFSLPYEDDYKPIPFSANFVRHTPGWYAEKHPDEDFAETFAVWLTPGTDWRKLYDDTPALVKLTYINRVAGEYGRRQPVVTGGKLDAPVQELTVTLKEWYETYRAAQAGFDLHPALNNDLRMLYPSEQGQPAALVLEANRTTLIREVNHWTGMNRKLLCALFDALLERIKSLELKIDSEQTTAHIVGTSVFLTTLAMNYVYRGQFVDT